MAAHFSNAGQRHKFATDPRTGARRAPPIELAAHLQAKSGARLAFLDWTLGLSGLIMIQGHVFHSFTATELRSGSAYTLSQFVSGMPPAIFLFVTGVTVAFRMDSAERKGFSAFHRFRAALRRAGYLCALAFLFRFQMWIFGLPNSPWTDLLRVDILNCMGLAVGALSFVSMLQTIKRARLCAMCGLVIAIASPLVSALDWSRAPLLRAYVMPDYVSFSFFPWASFVAFGMSVGSAIRLTNAEQLARMMQWTAIVGSGLIVAARYASEVPYSLYSKTEFWLDSPSLTFIKLGILLVALSFAYVWNGYVVCHKWSFIKQLGICPLLVYWVHTELVYGRWLRIFHGSLTVSQTLLMAAAIISLMGGLSALKTHWTEPWGKRRFPGFARILRD